MPAERAAGCPCGKEQAACRYPCCQWAFVNLCDTGDPAKPSAVPSRNVPAGLRALAQETPRD